MENNSKLNAILNAADKAQHNLNELQDEAYFEMLEIYGDDRGTKFKNFSHATSDELLEYDDYTGELIEQ